jgi:tryptophan-rich sensory protein
MSTSYALLTSLGICAGAAGLEGICAGAEVKSVFARLKSPAYTPPLWVWYIIGGLYYGTFFFVLFRVLIHGDNSALRNVTLGIIVVMMAANALWNYVFFRAQKLFASVIVTFLAPIMDLGLFVCLTWVDQVAVWALMPYLIYRLYSLYWAYALWKLNGHPA